MPQKAFVYLIKIQGFLGNPESHIARYYLGSTIDLRQRMSQHRSNSGAAIVNYPTLNLSTGFEGGAWNSQVPTKSCTSPMSQ
ncbi:MAG: GIY-YIG nuclease family protein [Plectolyngbya sp. WJT66-NPBG17]|jgi:predicted GIY-YIG superfamily endonuclease|nr:GIY-YIG nuclease family protein [Plectolyngbya sp. WJT66-NPBG17]